MQVTSAANPELAIPKSVLEQPIHTSSHEIVAAMAYWIVRQGRNVLPQAYPKLEPALRQFQKYIEAWIKIIRTDLRSQDVRTLKRLDRNYGILFLKRCLKNFRTYLNGMNPHLRNMVIL